MNSLYLFLAKQALPSVIRHVLAAVAGFLVSKGISFDASDLVSILTGITLFVVTYVWSFLTHTTLDDTGVELFRKSIAALLRNGQTALLSWMAGHGISAGDGTASVIILGVVNYLISLSGNPAAEATTAAPKIVKPPGR
jgi:hypothetical protein